jgi:hypothetical protein
MPYIILRGRWCDIIVLNVHDPTEDKIDDTTEDKIDDIKDRFYEQLEHVFDKFPKYHMKTSDCQKYNSPTRHADSHSILNRWKICFSQLLNVMLGR